ncbi:MAG TPA: AAA-like domain-containing protein, partial [Coleofasciculaceae cyanobacterium]
ELPEGPVNLDSPFYIKRDPLEARCYDEIRKPGALVSVRASSLMGKTSLKYRLMAHATTLGYHTIRLNFDQADEDSLTDLNRLLRWFCAAISQQLRLEPKLDGYWNPDFGAKVSATVYLQEYVLGQLDRPVLLALDEVNRLFQYAEITQGFLSLLRSWYEEAKDLEVWQKLRLLVIHSTEFYVPLDINQSPFNVGLAIRLPEFNPAQVHELAHRHGLAWNSADNQALMAMIGGHPYRVRLAFYHLAQQELGLGHLLRDAPTPTGIYRHRLHHHWNTLQRHPDLKTAMEQIVLTDRPVPIDSILAYQLESMGLIRLERSGAIPSCEVYRIYFQTQFGQVINPIKQLNPTGGY